MLVSFSQKVALFHVTVPGFIFEKDCVASKGGTLSCVDTGLEGWSVFWATLQLCTYPCQFLDLFSPVRKPDTAILKR